MDEMAAFHRAMHAAPDDRTPALVYADWLDDHDHPEAAEVIRAHGERVGPPHHNIYGSPQDPTFDLEPGQFGFGHFGNSRAGTLALRQRSAADPDRLFLWHFAGPAADRSRLIAAAEGRGEKVTTPARWFLAANPPPQDTSGTEYGHPDLLARKMGRLARAYQATRRR